jgi:hypothetical protein
MPKRKDWLGYVSITLVSATIVACVPLAIVIGFFAVSRDTSSISDRPLLFVLAACLLVLPLRVAWVFLRRKKKTGSFRLLSEELDAVRARCARPETLKSRLIKALLYASFAICWTYIEFERSQHSASMAVLAGIWWLITGLYIYRVFRLRQYALPER